MRMNVSLIWAVAPAPKNPGPVTTKGWRAIMIDTVERTTPVVFHDGDRDVRNAALPADIRRDVVAVGGDAAAQRRCGQACRNRWNSRLDADHLLNIQ